MASPSPSPSLTFPCSYDVFLSFRGKDTRKTFSDHLYTALTQAGIHTFRDDDEIERGEDIKRELEKAIHQSKVAVIVFSPEYAFSRWCLDELVLINERRKADLCHILPIYYHVERYIVRWEKKSFGDAFARHEKRYKEQPDKLDKWRSALKEVADLSCEVLKDQHEALFIQNIVKLVGNKLNRKLLYVDSPLVGIASYLKDINWWLQDESTNARILTVHGIGGVGKTSIAKTVYNQNYAKFERCCYLADVRETLKQPEGVLRLQNQILRDMGRKEKVNNADEGVMKIKSAICCRKVLIVLDDVDDLKQFRKFIGQREWLSSVSKIIITTQHKSLFNDHNSIWNRCINPLNGDYPFELFKLRAFGKENPPENLIEYSKLVVSYCGGLPLALSLLGSSFSRLGPLSDVKTAQLWDSAIHEMQEVLNGDVLKIIRISYDSLENDSRRQLFLHIACFFIGMDHDDVVYILDACDFHTEIGIKNLIDRCLITINEYNKLTMHQLVRDMGREIVRQESDEPGERSRVWNHQEAFHVLTEETGTKNIKGITLDSLMLKKVPFSPVSIQTKAFAKMHKLELLQLNNVRLEGSIENFPKTLVWLCWHGFPCEYIQSSYHVKKLVVLDMSYSNLRHIFQESLHLPCLKILDLSNSDHLITTTNFNVLPNLERLILKNCTKLVNIDESIGVLQRLVLLNLSGCIKLKNLPRTIGHLKALQELYLAGCTELISFPREMVYMEKMKVLVADGITLQELSTSIDDREVNQHSDLGLVSRVGTKRNQLSLAFLPSSLIKLSLRYCKLSDDGFPGNLRLPFLKILNLKGNTFHTMPDEIFKGFPSLYLLKLNACRNLVALPDVPESLKSLKLFGCQSITKLPNLSTYDGFTFDVLVEEDIAMIHSLKLFHKDMMRNFDLEMYSIAARMRMTSPVKALREHGIFSIFHPGSEIPSWYKYQEKVDAVSFVLEDEIIYALNICVVYEVAEHAPQHAFFYGAPDLTVRIRRNSKLLYSPTFFAVGVSGGGEGPSEVCKDILWLSCWNCYNVINAGDEVNVSVNVSEEEDYYFYLEVKGIGVHPVVQREWDDFLPTLRAILPPSLSQNQNDLGYFKSIVSHTYYP